MESESEEDGHFDQQYPGSQWDSLEDAASIWLQEHGPIALQVYKDVWDEFYSYETTHCQSTIHNLSKPYKFKAPWYPEPHMHLESQAYIPSNHASEKFRIEDFSAEGSTVRISYASTDPTEVGWDSSVTLDPYPRYTTCTPATHNVCADPDTHVCVRFIPFADEPNFARGHPEYLEEFNRFAWQTDFVDPDLDMVEIEAARRLHYSYTYTYEQIDKFGLLRVPMQKTSKGGLVWRNTQRDTFWWPGANLNNHPPFPSSSTDPELSLYKEVTQGLINFCPRLSCSISFCKAHGEAAPIIPPKATITSRKMLNGKRKPCNRDCYKTVDLESINMVNDHWNDAERSLFKSVMILGPDTHPCDMAVICRRPCYEVYIERLKQLPDEQIETETLKEARPNITFVNPNLERSDRPCSHEGPCNQHECPCYKKKQNCQRSCRCTKKCKLRRKGCRCHNKTKSKSFKPCEIDADSTCPCVQQLMECDPELCIGCDARGATHSSCQNMNLQRGKFARIHIKPSKYGLGAFATRPIKSGSYIGEYVGERFSAQGAGSLDDLQKHAHLNYAFGYVGENLDSWRIGNETRYLNDSKPMPPNCNAKLMSVDNEPRIVIESTRKIAAGEELFLSYGDDYWIKK